MTRKMFFTFSIILLAALWLGPIPELAKKSFSAHMGLHMGLVAMAAPFLAFGIAGSKVDPIRRWPQFFPPIPLSIFELIVVWAWHTPSLHHAARHGTIGFIAEQTAFLISGLLVWLSAFGGTKAQLHQRAGSGVIALLLTSMHMTLLGALLALSPRALYLHTGDMTGLTPLEDQHLGGAIMLIIGSVSYLAGGLWLTKEMIRHKIAPKEIF